MGRNEARYVGGKEKKWKGQWRRERYREEKRRKERKMN